MQSLKTRKFTNVNKLQNVNKHSATGTCQKYLKQTYQNASRTAKGIPSTNSRLIVSQHM